MFTCLGCNVLFCAYSLYSTGLHTVHCRVEWFLKFRMDWALSMLRQIVLWPKFQNITLECCTFARYTAPKEIDFPRYSMKCSGENVILRGIFHVLSRFSLHFMLYRGNLDCFYNRVHGLRTFWTLLYCQPDFKHARCDVIAPFHLSHVLLYSKYSEYTVSKKLSCFFWKIYTVALCVNVHNNRKCSI